MQIKRRKKLKKIWKKCIFKRKWRHDSSIMLFILLCKNDNKLVDAKCSQLMSCIFCYASLILISNAKTKARKVLILDNNENGINVFKKMFM
jgi:hypothetical protein